MCLESCDMVKQSIAILIGTRPELIKMAPVIRRLRERKIPFIFIHSGQHYSQEMDQQIMEDLKMPKPDYNLEVGSGTHASQTGRIMERVENICLERKPPVMLVHGDTNTTLAGALTAKKIHIPVGHIEAGLRSYDYRMPEEINRILTDRISDILFAPTEGARQNLLKEGIDDKLIKVTGNTVVDAVKEHLTFCQKSLILSKLGFKEEGYIVITAHRPENVDDPDNLKQLIELLDYVSNKLGKKIIWPIHPRTEKQVKEFKYEIPENILTIPPIGYIDMLKLLNCSALVLTDSGGVQEEAYVLRKPLITLRDSTERPETLTANFIVHLSREKVDKALKAYENNNIHWDNVFGNGTASDKIVDALVPYVN